MSSAAFPAFGILRPEPNHAQDWVDRRTAAVLRSAWAVLLVSALATIACKLIPAWLPSDEATRFTPANSFIRLGLAVSWNVIAVYSLIRVILGHIPSGLLVAAGIMMTGFGRTGHLEWQATVLAALAGVVIETLRLSQRPFDDITSRPAKLALASAVLLISIGLALMSPANSRGTLSQIGAVSIGVWFCLPFLRILAVRVLENASKWKWENVLWILSILLLAINIVWKYATRSTTHQMVLFGLSWEPFEVARFAATAAFELDLYRQMPNPSVSRLSHRSLLFAPLVLLEYALLHEKGTLALTLCGFAVSVCAHIGGRSKRLLLAGGLVVFGATLWAAHDRLAMALGTSANSQASFAKSMLTHTSLVGSIGGARPGLFLGKASVEDFALHQVLVHGGVITLAVVMAGMLIFLGSLFTILFRLKPGWAEAIAIFSFTCIGSAFAATLMAFGLGLVVGLPFPLVARGGSHLLGVLCLTGLLLAVSSSRPRATATPLSGGCRTRRSTLYTFGAVIAAAGIALARAGNGLRRPITDAERKQLAATALRVPALHGDLVSIDHVILARTVLLSATVRRFKREYDFPPIAAPFVGAGAEHVLDTGLQASLFRHINFEPDDSLRWLLGPHEFAPAASSADLTLHAGWARRIGELIPRDYRGVIVVLGLDGAIRAALSSPGFDPARISDEDYYKQVKTAVGTPLVNRPVYGRYQMASTTKPLSACVLVDLGLASGEFHCDGSHCGTVHGTVPDPETAIAVSCNAYFQSRLRGVPQSQWKLRLEDAGLGRMLVPGLGMFGTPVPAGQGGVGRMAAIGQNWTAAPIAIAGAFATIANRGKCCAPYILARLGGHPVYATSNGRQVFSPRACERALEGMRRSLLEGTSKRVSETYRGSRLRGCKTGTASTADGSAHALMVAISDHIVVAIREHGGTGSNLGPLVGQILNTTERSSI